MRARFSIGLLVALSWAGPRAVQGQEAATEPKAVARGHFEKALVAGADQRFGESLDEFEKAYEIAPDFHVLYNIGKVRVLLGRFAEGVGAYEGYLAQGGAEVAQERAAEVRAAIATALAHVATITIRVSVDDADVRVDGRLVGRSPLRAPLRLTEGKHTIEALVPNRPAQLSEADLPGGSTMNVDLTFPVGAKLELPSPTAAPAPVVDLGPSPVATRRWRVVGWSLSGAGLVALVAGGVIAYRSASDANAARARLVEAAMPPRPAMPDLETYDVAKADYDAAKTRNQLGWAITALGGAAIASGLSIVLFAPTERASGLALGGTW